MFAVNAETASPAKSPGHGLSGNKALSPSQGAEGREATEIDDNDLGHLLYGLELDDIEDDLPNSTIVPDVHDLVSEGDKMQEDLPFRSAIELVSATPIETPQPLASWPWPLLSPLVIQNLHPDCVLICVPVYLCSYVPHSHLFDFL